MSTWDIKVADAAGTIQGAANAASDYVLVETRMQGIATSAPAALDASQPVLMALGEFFQEVAQPDLEAIHSRVESAVTNTALAVQHYVDGDLTMAGDANTAAGQALVPESLPGRR